MSTQYIYNAWVYMTLERKVTSRNKYFNHELEDDFVYCRLLKHHFKYNYWLLLLLLYRVTCLYNTQFMFKNCKSILC